MDLNKDNRNVYTVDVESYSEYMNENWKKPTDFLSSFIKILLLVLLVVVGYFFYKIVKADLTFSEVFNKQQFLSTYSLFNTDEKSKNEVIKEDYVEVLAQNISTNREEAKKTVVLTVSKKHDELVSSKKEEVEIEEVAAVVTELSLEEPPSLVADEVKTIEEPIQKVIEEKKEELEVKSVEPVIVETIASEILTHKEEAKSNVLTETYLDRMVEELNSL